MPLLGKGKSTQEVMKEQGRAMKRVQRGLERDKGALEKEQKQLNDCNLISCRRIEPPDMLANWPPVSSDDHLKIRYRLHPLQRILETVDIKEQQIKAAARRGDRHACTQLARSLTALRKQSGRLTTASAHTAATGTHVQMAASNVGLCQAIATTTKTMGKVNVQMDPRKTKQMMQAFERENTKLEMSEELVNDCMEEAFADSDEEGEADAIVSQVLDEIGIEVSDKMAKAPTPVRPSLTSKADLDIQRQLEALGVD
uniref:Charged multivesicular body protein 2Bb n=1 Tax=Eptatretus burgeri TaxID=7764 RepID=A0A8C4ND55_EPTBU